MRTSGVLMHISSLPSRYGIGTLGQSAYDFVDFLEKAGQTYWQILPLGPTGYGDSPYASSSTFAGNPYFIDLETLVRDGLVSPKDLHDEDFGDDITRVDYGKLYQNRGKVLRKAVRKMLERKDPLDMAGLDAFEKENGWWLDGFSLFSALKDRFLGLPWSNWPKEYRDAASPETARAKEELSGEIAYHRTVQYLFYRQWDRLKKYANDKGIRIIGDLPIYVALDSSDVWSNPDEFYLDEDLVPIDVGGCPPDAFTEDGQLWGNPLYRWDRMKENGYRWWLNRIRRSTEVLDVVRIDHFRGFEAYWAVPFGSETAKGGHWVKGPDIDLFRTVSEKLGSLPIIAEDLGVLTPAVYELMDKVGYPGMRVLEFAFPDDPGEESEHLPYRIPQNSVAYIGTHDNETAAGWLRTAPKETVDYAVRYMGLNREEGYNWGFIRTLFACPADTAVVQMQDLIVLGNEARMNEPSTIGNNWTWRIRPECINDWLAGLLFEKTATYKRLSERWLKKLAEKKKKEKKLLKKE